MDFYIGQIFTDIYPPEAAVWANANNAMIQKTDENYQIVAIAAPTLEETQENKITEIKTAFETVTSSGYVVSSLGYRADATSTSLTDVQGLIRLINSGIVETPVMFRDYDNAFHASTLEDLQTLELEITAHGIQVYAEKWALEAQVKAAETVDAVHAIDAHTMSGYDW